MALGRKRQEQQQSIWIDAQALPEHDAHPFYQKLNDIFKSERIDAQLEALAAPYYDAKMGRPGLPPGVYVRMTLLGYFENLPSDRRIAWQANDSLSLRVFLDLALTEKAPCHNVLSTTRRRLPLEWHQAVHQLVIGVLAKHGLVKGDTLGLDASTMEANASLRALVRRDSGEEYLAYVTKLAEESGTPLQSREDLARFDRQRANKSLSNDDWQNPHDPDAKVAKMKSGATDMAYKPEHAVDLDSGAIIAATIHSADHGDTSTGPATLETATEVLTRLTDDSEDYQQTRAEVVADKGYHSGEVLIMVEDCGYRPYISEKKSKHRRRWTDSQGVKSEAKQREQEAVYTNRRRQRGERGKALHRRRGELVERSFAHLLDQGGMRRTYLKGRAKVQKRYWLQVVAFNLSLVMRKLCGAGKPREFSDRRKALQALFCAFFGVLWGLGRLLTPRSSIPRLRRPDRGNFSTPDHHASLRTPLFGLCPGMGL